MHGEGKPKLPLEKNINNLKIKIKQMETRNVALTLGKAQEWYNSGNASLREVALQAFTEEELKATNFRCITTMADVLCALNMDNSEFIHTIKHLEKYSTASAAAYKLNLIRKALNMGKEMSLTKGTIWYPYTPFVTEKSSYYKDEIRNGEMEVVAKFSVDCENYLLLGGTATCGSCAGLGHFSSYNGVGAAYAGLGFLGCATKEIAQHMGKYFAKEIFEAKYGDTVRYSWK